MMVSVSKLRIEDERRTDRRKKLMRLWTVESSEVASNRELWGWKVFVEGWDDDGVSVWTATVSVENEETTEEETEP